MRPLLFLVSLSFLLAGCSDPSATPADEPNTGVDAAEELDLKATATTGVVRCIVVDEAIRPLSNVVVELLTEVPLSMTTGDSGNCGFDEVAPGTYPLRATRPGFIAIQTTVEVVAGVDAPTLVKLQLLADPFNQPYFQPHVYEGIIQCTTSVLVVCGGPNAIEPIMCEFFMLCYGNLTADRFTVTLYYDANLAGVQSELVWKSSQSLSPQLGLEMEAINTDPTCPPIEDPLAGAPVGGASGVSPIHSRVSPETIERWNLGGPCGIYHSIFAGDASGGVALGLPIGVTVQQTFKLISHEFHGFLPPEDWNFADDGEPRLP